MKAAGRVCADPARGAGLRLVQEHRPQESTTTLRRILPKKLPAPISALPPRVTLSFSLGQTHRRILSYALKETNTHRNKTNEEKQEEGKEEKNKTEGDKMEGSGWNGSKRSSNIPGKLFHYSP